MEYDSNLETNVPHSARVWNYWLGGTDNFAVDRAAGGPLWCGPKP
jgi:hypothetical protein